MVICCQSNCKFSDCQISLNLDKLDQSKVLNCHNKLTKIRVNAKYGSSTESILVQARGITPVAALIRCSHLINLQCPYDQYII